MTEKEFEGSQTIVQTTTSREQLLASDAAELWMEQLKKFVAELEQKVREAAGDPAKIQAALAGVSQVVEAAGALEGSLKKLRGLKK
jgi:uncharacterized protein YfcZ (UPF0381/DUF406 family)